MPASSPKHMHWTRHVRVVTSEREPGSGATTDTRERLVAALADRPRTVAQLAHQFGLSQPTVLEQVRRAARDGLIVEARIPIDEKRYPSERYYTPAVPVIRQPDREILESACRSISDDLASSLRSNEADLRAAFAMTHAVRDGWTFDDLWPFVQETFVRLALEQIPGTVQPASSTHGLLWVEEVMGDTDPPTDKEEVA
jgi:DNA-binding Lrp family transcriptional regulator